MIVMHADVDDDTVNVDPEREKVSASRLIDPEPEDSFPLGKLLAWIDDEFALPENHTIYIWAISLITKNCSPLPFKLTDVPHPTCETLAMLSVAPPFTLLDSLLTVVINDPMADVND